MFHKNIFFVKKILTLHTQNPNFSHFLYKESKIKLLLQKICYIFVV